MKYFTIKELSRSNTALVKGIDNNPLPEIERKLTALVKSLLDPIRECWGKPIIVNSGYRSPTLNDAVNGSAVSQHTKGEAADITAGDPRSNKKLFDMIIDLRARGMIEFDQLIDEKNYRWLHISLKGDGNRNQILHLK